MNSSNKYGFTLVELIVVITILSILSTIGFISYGGYLRGVRDANRTSQVSNIHDGLELLATKKDLPTPDSPLLISSSSSGTLGRQGYAGTGVLDAIDFTKGGKDPRDNEFFIYYLDSNNLDIQLLAFLEESDNLSLSLIPKVSAVDYTDRFPLVIGKKLGVLLQQTTNKPIQEVYTGTSITLESLTGATDIYDAYFRNSDIYTGSGASLVTQIMSKR